RVRRSGTGEGGDMAASERFVVCGDDPLTSRVVEELAVRFDADVTVVLRSRLQGRGPEIGRLERVRIVEADQIDDAVLRTAGALDATALVMVDRDGVTNFRTALRARQLNPDLRMVLRQFDMSAALPIRRLFEDCTVLSDAAIAAPGMVSAALGE